MLHLPEEQRSPEGEAEALVSAGKPEPFGER